MALQELNSRMADRDGLIRFPPNFVVSVEQSLPEETSAEIYERIDVFGYIKN